VTLRRTGLRSRRWLGWWCARIVSARSRFARTRTRPRSSRTGRKVRSCPVVELKSGTKTSTIPRRVVVVSTSPDVTPPVVGVWTNPDADSQTIVTEQRIESSTVTTVAAAESLARMSGERWARPQQSVQVTVPARPDLGYRDPVALTRHQAGVSGVYRVQSWDLTLSGPDDAPALMPVTMMVRQ
jgi:hypothetical protein